MARRLLSLGITHAIPETMATSLLKICPCPVLLARSMPPRPYRHRVVFAGTYQDENPGGHRNDRYAINRKIPEHATWLATSRFAELHVVHAWEAYGEQYLRKDRSPFYWDVDNYVESEQKRNSEALNTCLSELRESVVAGYCPRSIPCVT